MIRQLIIAASGLLLASPALALDLESFDFADADDTPLTAAVNTANPGNSWFYDEEATTPGDESTGDVSTVQSGAYQIITDSSFATGLDSRYLDIPNTDSGTVYLSATFSGWSFGTFDGSTAEQVRFTFLDDDTGTSGSTVTAQMQIRRNTTTGSMELFGDAIGTSGSFDIATTVDLPDTQANPFTMVLALDKDANSFEVFYKDGTAPSQSLGLGGVSRARDGNSVRMVTNNFGAENFLPFVVTEEALLDRVAVSDTNPLTDFITLEVDRDTGAMTLINTSGSTVSGVTGVTLDSAVGAIDLADFTDFSGSLGVGQSVALDSSPVAAPGLWVRSPLEDVSASLATAGGERTLDVNFVGNSGVKWVTGDLDFDGTIDADDYGILALNAESDLSGLATAVAYQLGDLNDDGANDAIDFGLFKNAFIAANGAPAFARLVAGVPEPGTLGLAALGLLSLATRRRRPHHITKKTHKPMSFTMPSQRTRSVAKAAGVFLLLAAIAPRAEAIIFEDFLFDDTAGTLITEVANTANPGSLFTEDADSIDVATNGLGQLDASLKANTGFGTNFLDVEPALTTGTIFGVMELTWDFQSTLDTAENEEIRISLINNNPTGTQITGEFRIVRTDADEIIINGQAGGTGSSDLPDTLLNGGSLVQSDKFIAVVAADLDNSTYEILYSNDAGASFLSAGTGNSAPGRIVESMRMTLNNDLSSDNVLIDRVYLADALPIVIDPDSLTLYVHPKSGHVAIVNETGTVFDIDYYRIQSGDDSLVGSQWNSLQSQAVDAVDGADGGSTAGDGTGETWTEAGGSDAGVLSESFLLSSSQVVENETLPLGGAFDLSGDDQQLTFEFRDSATGNVFEGDILVGDLLDGDFNLDGKVDAADYTVYRDNVSGLFTAADYTVWADNYGAQLAASSSSSAVPEPASLGLLAGAFTLMLRRRRVS